MDRFVACRLVRYSDIDFTFVAYEMDKPTLSAFESARFSVKLSRIFMVATLAVAVFSAVMTIIDLCRDKSIEQLPIPNYLVDNYTDADGGSYSLNYKAVECNRMDYFGADYKKQKGDCADINADEGKQWLELHRAGEQFCPRGL